LCIAQIEELLRQSLLCRTKNHDANAAKMLTTLRVV
jgi:hypothetical protein